MKLSIILALLLMIVIQENAYAKENSMIDYSETELKSRYSGGSRSRYSYSSYKYKSYGGYRSYYSYGGYSCSYSSTYGKKKCSGSGGGPGGVAICCIVCCFLCCGGAGSIMQQRHGFGSGRSWSSRSSNSGHHQPLLEVHHVEKQVFHHQPAPFGQ